MCLLCASQRKTANFSLLLAGCAAVMVDVLLAIIQPRSSYVDAAIGGSISIMGAGRIAFTRSGPLEMRSPFASSRLGFTQTCWPIHFANACRGHWALQSCWQFRRWPMWHFSGKMHVRAEIANQTITSSEWPVRFGGIERDRSLKKCGGKVGNHDLFLLSALRKRRSRCGNEALLAVIAGTIPLRPWQQDLTSRMNQRRQEMRRVPFHQKVRTLAAAVRRTNPSCGRSLKSG